MTTVAEIITQLHHLAPPHLRMENDPHGLLVGDAEAGVSSLVVCLDVSPAVAKYAADTGAQMIIAHHPLIYQPMKRVVASEPHPGSVVLSCIRAGIAVACAHTNWDVAQGGINDVLAGLIGLTDTEPVQVTYREPLVNLVVFVPVQWRERVWNAMAEAGAGRIPGSNYDRCAFWGTGTGTFRPMEGADPHEGRIGVSSYGTENRLETVMSASLVPAVLAAVRAEHGYEEVAHQIVPLTNTGTAHGLGRIGTLAETITGGELLARTKAALRFDAVRMVGDANKPVRTVAVGGGACAFLLPDALRLGADALITSDVRHHEFVDAEARGILLLDAGHAQTETPGIRRLSERLADALPGVAVHFV